MAATEMTTLPATTDAASLMAVIAKASSDPAIDVVKLERLMALKAETVTWIEGKNDRELKQLDGVVEFVSSSRTAAKVLMWVCGAAVSFVVGVAAFAKGGYDMLAIFRGGK